DQHPGSAPGLRRGGTQLRRDGGAEPGLPRPPGHGRGRVAGVRHGCGPAPAGRPRMRLRGLDAGPGDGGPAGGPRGRADRRRRVLGDAGRGADQELARRGPLRARAGAGPGGPARGVRARGSRRRGARRLPVPQRQRARRGAPRRPRPAGPGGRARGPGVLRRPVPGGRPRLVARLLAGRHPDELADVAPDPAVPLPVAQRPQLRRRPDLRRPPLRRRLRRRGGLDGAGLAARHPAHLPRPPGRGPL
ncbi:MAG: CrtT-methyltransferase-like protein, partial [uncultured Friedmanniella sp.]